MRRSGLILLFLLGGWSFGTIFMWQTAIQNFRVAERVAVSENEGLEQASQGLQKGSLREIVRFQAGEVNRFFFIAWGWTQLPLALGVLILALQVRLGWTSVALAIAMLAIVSFLAFFAVPETVRLGRMMDFLPDGSRPEIERVFWRLHHTYTALDTLKLCFGIATAALAWRRAG